MKVIAPQCAKCLNRTWHPSGLCHLHRATPNPMGWAEATKPGNEALLKQKLAEANVPSAVVPENQYGQVPLDGMPDRSDPKPRDIPRAAIYHGRRVRVVGYAGDNRFDIVDTDDSRTTVSKSALTFIKG